MARAKGATRHTGSGLPVRTFAEEVSERSDDELVALLVDRPDLARPAPADLAALAARAATRGSVHRAVERLDAGTLQVLLGVVVAADRAPAATRSIAALLGADPAAVEPGLERLRGLALVWPTDGGWRVVGEVAQVLGPHPAGLGQPAANVDPRYAAHTPPDAAQLAELLEAAPPQARAVLDSLTWGPPTGSVPPSGPTHEAAGWLVERGVLAPSGLGHVTLVREVALALRGGRLHREPLLDPPPATSRAVDAEAVERAGGAAGRDCVDAVHGLVDHWSAEPPRVLRTGGLAVRDLAALARTLDLPEEQAAFVAELALAAGLVADDGGHTPAWAPTPEADIWAARAPGERWALLARAWRDTARAAAYVTRRTAQEAPPEDTAGSSAPALGPVTRTSRAPGGIRRQGLTLAPDGAWPPIRALRADVLAEVGRAEAGTAFDGASLSSALAWNRPLRDPRATAAGLAVVLREAEWLGVTALGTLTRAGRALAGRAQDEQLADLVALPAAVDHVLVQADLTLVAPGPLEGELGRFVRLVSDVESRGGATVLRLTPASVRRAFDAGWTAEDLLDALRRFSRTPVPQPVDYLVRDTGRRHGQARVGGATAYLRSDDEATLATMLADRALAPAMLRRLAPTVLVSSAEPRVLLDLLRDGGYAPAQEAFDGSLVVAEPPRRRSRGRRPGLPTPGALDVDRELAAAVVAAVRRAPARPAAARTPAGALATDPATTSAVLRLAVSDSRAVWLGYADGNGRTARHLVRPVRLDGGRLYAVSGESEGEQVFLLHRITGVAAS